MSSPTPLQKAWLARLRPELPRYFPDARGHLDLRIAGPPELRTNSRLFPFTLLEDGLPRAEILVKAPQGRKAANVRLAFEAYRLLNRRLADDPDLAAPEALDAWEDPPALIMIRAEGDPLYLRLRDCRNWAGEAGCQLAQNFVRLAGRWLARLHDTRPPDWSRPAPAPLARLDDWLNTLRAHGIDPLEEKRIRDRTRILADAPPSGAAPLHGDFTLRNVLCRLPQHITVLDTELAQHGDPAADIGWFLAALHAIDKWQIVGGEMVYTRAVIRQTENAFLQGYESVRPLPPKEIIRAYTTLRLTERWAEFVEREKQRDIAGLRTFVIRRINQHFVRAMG